MYWVYTVLFATAAIYSLYKLYIGATLVALIGLVASVWKLAEKKQ